MIRSISGNTVTYSTRDMAVYELSKHILEYLGMSYDTGASVDGAIISIQTSQLDKFEREVTQWREAAAKLVIQPAAQPRRFTVSEQNKEVQTESQEEKVIAPGVVETAGNDADVERALDADEEENEDGPQTDPEEHETEGSDEDLPEDEDRGDAAEEGSTAHTEILNRLTSIVAEQLGVNPSEVSAESNLQDDLGADSLDSVELVMAVEDEFELEIPDEKVETFNTVNDIVNYLIERNVTTG